MEKHTHIGQMILRLGVGILFFAAGLLKLIFAGPSGITNMLDGIGFPIAIFFAWILILAELIGGAALILGFKTKWASILLGIVMIIAILTVQVKTFVQDFPAQMAFFKDLAILVGLASIYFSGPGCYCIIKKHQ